MADEDLLQLLAEHEQTERDRIGEYERLAQACPDSLVRYLMDLIVEDERKHHTMVEKLTTAVTEGRPDEWLMGRHRPSWVPSSAELTAVEESIGAETEAAGRSQDMAEQYEAGPIRALLMALANDSRKHAEVLSAVAARMRALGQVHEALTSDATAVAGLIRSATTRLEEPTEGGAPLDTALHELRRFIFVTENVVLKGLRGEPTEKDRATVEHAHAEIWRLIDDVQASRQPPVRFETILDDLHRIVDTFDDLMDRLTAVVYPALVAQLEAERKEEFLRGIQASAVPPEWEPTRSAGKRSRTSGDSGAN